MMTGPIDARIKDYIDQRLSEHPYDTDPLDIEISLKYLFRLLIEQRQMVVTERSYCRLAFLKLTLGRISSTEEIRYESGNNRLRQRSEWFMGAIREANNPELVYEEWLTTLKKELDQLGLTELLRSDDQLPASPSFLEGLF